MNDARIRLEGAWERLEAALPRYLRARALLRERRWLAAVRRAPHLLESAAEGEVDLALDLSRARSLSANDSALAALLGSLDKAHAELLRAISDKLGEAPRSLSDGVARLLALVRLALPGPERPGERTIAVIAAEKPNEAALGVVTVFGAPYLVALSADQPEAIPWVIGGAGLALAGFVGRALTTAVIGGTCTVTNERVVWRPHRGEPRQCELAQLSPASVRMKTPRTVELRAPDVVSMRMLESPAWAATAVALQAWAGVLPRGPARVTFPCSGGRDAARLNRGGFGIVWEKNAAFIANADGKRAAQALLGANPRFNVDVDALTTVLSQLPPERLEAALDQIVKADAGFVLRTESATVKRSGPPELILTDFEHELRAKRTEGNEAQLGHALQLFQGAR